MLIKKTTTTIFNNRFSTLLVKKDTSNSIKYIKYINQVQKKSDLIFFNINGVYTTLNSPLVNKRLIFKNLIISNNFTENSLKTTTNYFLNTLSYPLISKFKIEGRVFRVKKKQINFYFVN